MSEYKGSFGLVIHQGKLLMLLRDNDPEISNPNKWCLIGGADEEGETYEQTFMREAEEEIGIRPSQAKFLQLFEYDDKRYAVFVAPLTDDEANQIKLGDEGQELKFFEREELDGLEVAQTSQKFMEAHPEVLVSELG